MCLFGAGYVWYRQLKRGLTIHAFTQPQSISHLSSTHPQRKMLKRDKLGKLNLAQRIPQSYLGRVTPEHTTRTCLYLWEFHWQTGGRESLVEHAGSPKMLNVIPFPCYPFKSNLPRGNNGRNVRPLEPVSGGHWEPCCRIGYSELV